MMDEVIQKIRELATINKIYYVRLTIKEEGNKRIKIMTLTPDSVTNLKFVSVINYAIGLQFIKLVTPLISEEKKLLGKRLRLYVHTEPFKVWVIYFLEDKPYHQKVYEAKEVTNVDGFVEELRRLF
ncbi:MAG: hypothetical protein ACK41Q_07885 [Candidatus Brocadia sp.]